MTENNSTQQSLKQDALVLSKRIMNAKIKMISEHPFFGLLVQNVAFAIDPKCPTACTDGDTIFFGQEFSQKLNDEELYFLLMHELMHIVLGHCFRGKNLDDELFNIACDIVINSELIDEMRLSCLELAGDPIMHLTPQKTEGRKYTAEEVYALLLQENEVENKKQNNNLKKNTLLSSGEGGSDSKKDNDANTDNSSNNKNSDSKLTPTDDHSKWGTAPDNEFKKSIWQQRILETCETLENAKQAGSIPSLAKLVVKEIKNPTIDWRSILNSFVQQEINDYSFSPPDRRFSDFDVLLPDFNETEDYVRDIWIAIDTSGSISSEELALAYNEVKGAINQYNGRFQGWLSFFDCKVSEPKNFESISDLMKITPVGGGGTSFKAIFEARKTFFKDDIAGIIIITDGYATWPKEDEAQGTPVLWLINNKYTNPPWGIVARMTRTK